MGLLRALARRSRPGGPLRDRVDRVTTSAAVSVDPLAAPVTTAVRAVDDGPAGRRRCADRRSRPTPMWSRRAFFGGRRRTVRRVEEREGAFVDVHGHRLFLLVSAIVALNLLDAWFTLLFLSHGGRELNPFVQIVLDLEGHPWPFLWLKTFGIGVACTFLVLTKNFRPARLGLWFVFWGYLLLLGWHIYLRTWLASID